MLPIQKFINHFLGITYTSLSFYFIERAFSYLIFVHFPLHMVIQKILEHQMYKK